MLGINAGPAPADAQLEVTLIGPGYGETVCIHFGDGRWIVIDSCRDPKDKNVASIKYLISLGVDVSKQVKLLLATHWHDDHCDGMYESLAAFNSATFCVANVLSKVEFAEFVELYNSHPTAIVGSRVNEFQQIFRHLRANKQILSRRAGQGTCLLSIPRQVLRHNEACVVTALSPSDLALSEFLERIVEFTPTGRDTKSAAPDIKPNDSSVALLIEIGKQSMLFGADLEQRGSMFLGWKAVVNANNCPVSRSTIIKIPHHGSKNAHNADIWSNRLVPNPIAMLTPWASGRGLPSKADVERIEELTHAAFSTAIHRPNRTRKRDQAVSRQLKDMKKKLRAVGKSFGAVRLRTSPTDPNSPWCIELLGEAAPIAEVS